MTEVNRAWARTGRRSGSSTATGRVVTAWAGIARPRGRSASRCSGSTRTGSARWSGPPADRRRWLRRDRHAGVRHGGGGRAGEPGPRETGLYDGILDLASSIVVPLDPRRPGHRGALRLHPRAPGLDARGRRVRGRGRDPRLAGDPQRRPVRPDRGLGRPARGPPGGVGPDEPAEHRRVGRPGDRRGGRPDHRLPQLPGLPARGARRPRPDRLRGSGRRVREGRPGPPPDEGRRGLHRLGRGQRPAAPGPRRQRRSAGRDDPRHRRRRRVDAVRPDALRRAGQRGHHPLEARSRPVRRRRPAPAVDPRRPGGHGRRVGPTPRPERAPRRRSSAGSWT